MPDFLLREIRMDDPLICNIIDKRKKPYRWKSVFAIVEATCHDNSVKDSDQIIASDGYGLCEDRKCISIEKAVEWANGFDCGVTLFIYDADNANEN